MNKPTKSPIDIHIDSIVNKLKVKHKHASRNRYADVVDFFYGPHLEGVVEIPFTDLEESLETGLLPKKIKNLL
jgi:hypothetical protein